MVDGLELGPLVVGSVVVVDPSVAGSVVVGFKVDSPMVGSVVVGPVVVGLLEVGPVVVDVVVVVVVVVDLLVVAGPSVVVVIVELVTVSPGSDPAVVPTAPGTVTTVVVGAVPRDGDVEPGPGRPPFGPAAMRTVVSVEADVNGTDDVDTSARIGAVD